MRLTIRHTTEYAYDGPVGYGLSRIRMTPRDSTAQRVIGWAVTAEGAVIDFSYDDAFGNRVTFARTGTDTDRLTLHAEGEVETFDTHGILGRHLGHSPLRLFTRPTALTQPGDRIADLAARVTETTDLGRLHQLSALVSEAVRWTTETTDVATSAEEALGHGAGVCQDQAHVFCAAARMLGFPARYVGGYFAMDEAHQAAGHAWAEAHVEGLGWVGFDIANAVCPDERHLRIATGRDYGDAAPVTGMRYGTARETMDVSVTVMTQQQQ